MGTGMHLVPPPQTDMDLERLNYMASEVDVYETYLKMIPTNMQSTGESSQVQRQFFSHAVGQMQNLVVRKIENLPSVKRVREMPNNWLKSATKAITTERVAASADVSLENLSDENEIGRAHV